MNKMRRNCFRWEEVDKSSLSRILNDKAILYFVSGEGSIASIDILNWAFILV